MKWTVEGSEIVHRDRWISVRADRCVNGRGVSVAPFYVLEYPDWVNGLAITEEQEVILVRQYRHGVERVGLELPGGVVDPGEEPLAAFARELLEETGYGAESVRATVQLAPNPSSQTNWAHSFVATGCRRIAEPRLDATEDIEVVTMPVNDFVEWLFAGELAQAIHYAAAMAGLRDLELLKLP